VRFCFILHKEQWNDITNKYDLFYTSNKFDSGHKLPLGSCTGHGTLSDVEIFSLSGVEPDIQVQGKFTLFGGARLFFLGGSSVKLNHMVADLVSISCTCFVFFMCRHMTLVTDITYYTRWHCCVYRSLENHVWYASVICCIFNCILQFLRLQMFTFLSIVVCLFVRRIMQKLLNWFWWNLVESWHMGHRRNLDFVVLGLGLSLGGHTAILHTFPNVYLLVTIFQH